jgi:hypothetical protein
MVVQPNVAEALQGEKMNFQNPGRLSTEQKAHAAKLQEKMHRGQAPMKKVFCERASAVKPEGLN